MSAYELIAAERADYPIGLLCEVLGVPRLGHDAWSTRAPSDRQLTDAWRAEQIREVHAENREVYGAPRRVPGVRVADDLVERDFKPAGPNVLWVADITYLRTGEGWLSLAAVQDASWRRIVGWSMTDHMRSDAGRRRAAHGHRPAPTGRRSDSPQRSGITVGEPGLRLSLRLS